MERSLERLQLQNRIPTGKEGGKPDALTRRKADMPQEGEVRLTQKERIVLPKEKYFNADIHKIETIRLEETNDKKP